MRASGREISGEREGEKREREGGAIKNYKKYKRSVYMYLQLNMNMLINC